MFVQVTRLGQGPRRNVQVPLQLVLAGVAAWVANRADYRRERRSSNLPGFDITTNAFVLQVSLGWLGGGGTP